MPLTIPQLDDRSYQDLLDEAMDRIHKDLNTDWTDLSPGDPGVVLLEAFAFLTEQMLYRLNRVPEKAYVAFLNLLGVSLYPPTAARARLHIWQAGNETITLPRGTRIVPGGSNDDKLANAFVLAEELKIPANNNETTAVQALAYHCEQFEEELGISNGMPGQSFTVQRPPLVAPLRNWLDPVVGVEVPREEKQSGDKEGADERFYRPWQEVEHFSQSSPNEQVYTVDRTLGVIQFAPAVRKMQPGSRRPALTQLGAIPPAKNRIRVWYSRGGGEAGNLPANVLTEILDPPSGLLAARLTVTNPRRAWGGADGETLANALVRGPHEFFSHGNAVTARDYEQLVLRKSRSIARARAYARRELWSYAQPGTVEIVLVPSLPSGERQSITLKHLKDNERPDYLPPIQHELDERSPLGTRCELVWARYKKVRVEADLVVRPNANSTETQVKNRIAESLNRLISPLPFETQKSGSQASENTAGVPPSGWPFGQELRLAQVYQHVLASEQDITLINRLVLKIEEAPDRDVRCLAADNFQPDTWYAASAGRLFRSTNNGLGWEKVLAFAPEEDESKPNAAREATFEGGRLYLSGVEKDRPIWSQTKERRPENVIVVCPSPSQPGVVAVATHLENIAGPAPNHGASALYATANCGETWYCLVSHFDGEIEDLAWLLRGNRHILLLATNCGLYEMDVVFQAAGEPMLTLSDQSERAPSGEPPAGPAPDEKEEIIMPHLAPVDPDRPTLPLYAVAVISGSGNARVAVAARNRQGVFLSRSDDLIPVVNQAGGKASANFDYLGLYGEDVRHLNVQKFRSEIFLWAAAMAVGDVAHGCYRWEFDARLVPGQIVEVSYGWTGGSCYGLAFQGAKVLAATAWGGILTAEFDPDNWTALPYWLGMGTDFLPRHISTLDPKPADSDEAAMPSDRLPRFFSPLLALATNDSARPKQPILMTGGREGVYRRLQEGTTFDKVSRTEFRSLRDAVTLPPNWLFVCDVKINENDARHNDKGEADGS